MKSAVRGISLTAYAGIANPKWDQVPSLVPPQICSWPVLSLAWPH